MRSANSFKRAPAISLRQATQDAMKLLQKLQAASACPISSNLTGNIRIFYINGVGYACISWLREMISWLFFNRTKLVLADIN